MANTRTKNVLRVTSSATFVGSLFIESIKYIGASSGSALVADAASTNTVWEESGTSNVYNADLDITATEGVTVTITNSAVVYLYTK